MKKSLIFTLAATAMLCVSVFTGCSELPDEEGMYPSEETKAKIEAEKNNTKKAAVPEDAKVLVDFTKMTDSSRLSGSGAKLIDDTTFKDGTKVLSVEEAHWNIACAKLDVVDLSGKTIYVLARGTTPENKGSGSNDGIAFFIASNNTGSADDDSTAWTARSDYDFTLTDASKFKEYEFKVSDFGKFYNATENADVSSINYVGFRLKNANFGSFQVAAIYYK